MSRMLISVRLSHPPFGLALGASRSPRSQEYEFTSGVGVRTTGGHSWNREQIFFPVKVKTLIAVSVSVLAVEAVLVASHQSVTAHRYRTAHSCVT